jgi:hypothetical protein
VIVIPSSGVPWVVTKTRSANGSGGVGAEGQRLGRLTVSVGDEGAAHERGQRHDPPARDGLRLDELQPAVDPRQRMADREGATLKVDVGPAQAEDLALPEPDAEGDEVEGLEPIPKIAATKRPDLLH